jgi:SAM-dependent methyltransferase
LVELARLIDAHGAEQAATAFCEEEGCRRRGPTAGWAGLVDVPPDGTLLELGSGFGDDALTLGEDGARVASLAPDPHTAGVLVQRLGDRANHGVAILRDLARIPLADGSVDAIATEETGLAGFDVEPHRFDDLLKEWRRLLRPGGQLVITLRNRRSPLAALRGGGDPGPEPLNRHVKRLAARDAAAAPAVSTALRSLDGNGFERVQLYAPLPDGNETKLVLPIDDAGVARYCFDHLLRQNSAISRLAIKAADITAGLGLRAFVPELFVVARRGQA